MKVLMDKTALIFSHHTFMYYSLLEIKKQAWVL